MKRIAIASLLIVCCAVAAQAEVIVADADAYIHRGYTGNPPKDFNYGGDPTVEVAGRYNALRSHFFLQFDLTGLTIDPASVTAATLKLTGADGKAGARDVLFFAIMDEAKDWDLATLPEGTGTGQNTVENDITWDTAPQTPADATNQGTSFLEEGTGAAAVVRRIGTVSCDGATDINLDVTDLVLWLLGENAAYSDFAHTDGQITIAVRGAGDRFTEYTSPGYSWHSKEATPRDDSDAPRLDIVPEPATLGLLCIGGIAALIRRRR